MAVIACLGGVILTSCDSVESDSFSDSGKIAFVTSDEDETDWGVNTRAAIVSASDFNSKVSSFRVWGYFDSSAAADGATPGGLFVGESATAGAVINGNGSGTWTFANSSLERFWPPTNSPLNFQAVAPASDGSFTISNTVSNNLPHVVANVTVPTDNAAQKDIMFASASSQTQSSNSGKVALAFKHAMSAIRFSAKTSASTITAEVGGISLCNIRSTGKVGYITDNTLGYSTNASPVASYALGMSAKTLSTTLTNLTNSDGNLILLPQATTAWSPSVPVASAGAATYVALSIKVAYNGVYRIGSSSAYETVYIPFAASWEQGKLYTYNLTIGTGTGVYDANGNTLETVPCSFTATASNWTEENTSEFSPTPAERAPVDMGLPSGTLWAAGNIGAELPWETGKYFAWGETTGYSAADVAAGVRTFDQTSYNAGSAASISADLTLEQDAAHVNLGGDWRMPTKDQFQELLDNCNVIWTADYGGTGVAGRVFTSKVNGNSVFFPAAGYCDYSSVSSVGSGGDYWSASWGSSSYAWELCFYSGGQGLNSNDRYYGYCVRGVITPPAESTPVDLGLPSGLKWAAGNIGAKNPEDYGLYFAWGETVGYTAEQVKSGERAFNSKNYKASSISTDLTLEQDAAHVNLGGNWRMPTKAECQELLDNCNVVWTNDYNGTGIKGRTFTSKVNGNSVFFPAAGCCELSSVYDVGSEGRFWSASWYSSSGAWYLGFDSRDQYVSASRRYSGQSVRGVCE